MPTYTIQEITDYTIEAADAKEAIALFEADKSTLEAEVADRTMMDEEGDEIDMVLTVDG